MWKCRRSIHILRVSWFQVHVFTGDYSFWWCWWPDLSAMYDIINMSFLQMSAQWLTTGSHQSNEGDTHWSALQTLNSFTGKQTSLHTMGAFHYSNLSCLSSSLLPLRHNGESSKPLKGSYKKPNMTWAKSNSQLLQKHHLLFIKTQKIFWNLRERILPSSAVFSFLHISAALKKGLQAKRGDWFLCASREAFLFLLS